MDKKVEEKEVFKFLDGLRGSGIVNMFGAGKYVEELYGYSRSDARKIVVKWMRHFEAREEEPIY